MIDKALQAQIDRLINQLLHMSGDLSELQDKIAALYDSVYDNGVDDGYKAGYKEGRDKGEEVKGWLRLINEFPLEYIAQEIDKIYPEVYKNEWISVKDKLPAGQWNVNHPWLSREVLIANSCSIEVGYYNRRDETWYIGTPKAAEWIDDITHWMPLPANPHELGQMCI